MNTLHSQEVAFGMVSVAIAPVATNCVLGRQFHIGPRVLTEREQGELGRIDGVTADEEVLLRFRYVYVSQFFRLHCFQSLL